MYCTTQDIKDEFKQIVFATQPNTGATLTESLVEEWIYQESEYIDAKISVRYQTPVTQEYPNAFTVLKRIAIFRVCQRVKNKIEVKTNATQLSSEEKFSENYVQTPNFDLDQIAKGNLILKNVPLVNSNGDVASSCGVECDVSTCHTFDVGKQQW